MKSLLALTRLRGDTILLKRFSIVCAFGLAMSYLSAYLMLRHRSISENRQYNSDGMLYDSVEHVEQTHDLRTHHFLSILFAPLNLLDQQLFGGPPPVRCMMFDLS